MLAFYWLSLFVATHIPGRGGPGVRHLDKVAHFVAYLGLAFLLTWALNRRRSLRVSAAVVLAVAVCYAIVDESMQMLVPGRTADVWDALADVCGSLAGIGIFAFAAYAWPGRTAAMQRQ